MSGGLKGLDVEAFGQQVLAHIPLLDKPLPSLVRGGGLTGSDREILERLLAEKYGREKAQVELAVLAASGDMTPQVKAYLGEKLEEIAAAKEQGNQLVNQSEFKRHACAALTSVSNDVFSIAKVLTPVLVGLVVAGTIVIPLSPLVFGGVALGVSRMGIAALCAEYKVKPKDGAADD